MYMSCHVIEEWTWKKSDPRRSMYLCSCLRNFRHDLTRWWQLCCGAARKMTDRRHKAPVRHFVIWPTKLPFKCHPYLQTRYSIFVHIIMFLRWSRAPFSTQKEVNYRHVDVVCGKVAEDDIKILAIQVKTFIDTNLIHYFLYKLHKIKFPYMFRASSAHLQEVNNVNCTCTQPLVFSFSAGGRLVHLLRGDW